LELRRESAAGRIDILAEIGVVPARAFEKPMLFGGRQVAGP
jgi:hypothetical protein